VSLRQEVQGTQRQRRGIKGEGALSVGTGADAWRDARSSASGLGEATAEA